MAEPITPRKRKRLWAMLNAYMTFHARRMPQQARDNTCWLLLLEWARLGGTADEVIHG